MIRVRRFRYDVHVSVLHLDYLADCANMSYPMVLKGQFGERHPPTNPSWASLCPHTHLSKNISKSFIPILDLASRASPMKSLAEPPLQAGTSQNVMVFSREEGNMLCSDSILLFPTKNQYQKGWGQVLPVLKPTLPKRP